MIERGTGRVTVGYLYPDQVEGNFHNCYERLWHFDRERPRGKPLINHKLAVAANSGGIAAGRNEIATEFLDNTDDEWLLFLDADMGFAPDTLDRLILAAGNPIERPIVGGLCFAQKVVSNGMDELGTPQQGYYYEPTIYQWAEGGVSAIADYPRDALVQCDATGAACLLIHRSVLETIRGSYEAPFHWFDARAQFGKPWGEDIIFCARAMKHGYPIWVDTAVKTSHKKSIYLTEESVSVLAGLRRDAPEERTFLIVPQDETSEPLAVMPERSLNRKQRRAHARA